MNLSIRIAGQGISLDALTFLLNLQGHELDLLPHEADGAMILPWAAVIGRRNTFESCVDCICDCAFRLQRMAGVSDISIVVGQFSGTADDPFEIAPPILARLALANVGLRFWTDRF